MGRHGLVLSVVAIIGPSTLAATGAAYGQAPTRPAEGGPATRQPAGPPPAEVRSALERAPLPALRSAADVPAFIAAASAAPVSRRENVRAAVQSVQGNTEIADRLVAEFESAQRNDFTRALIILSLIGEQRNPTGTRFLTAFLSRALPRGGTPTGESGISPQAEAMERLQVKAVNALAYARTPQASQATLDIVRSHPSKAVRIEAASSYLWNAGNSEEARSTLLPYLRPDERMVVDRPVRVQGMTAQQFNDQLALYLTRHPELRPPAPTRGPGAGSSTGTNEPAGPPPPSDGNR